MYSIKIMKLCSIHALQPSVIQYPIVTEQHTVSTSTSSASVLERQNSHEPLQVPLDESCRVVRKLTLLLAILMKIYKTSSTSPGITYWGRTSFCLPKRGRISLGSDSHPYSSKHDYSLHKGVMSAGSKGLKMTCELQNSDGRCPDVGQE